VLVSFIKNCVNVDISTTAVASITLTILVRISFPDSCSSILKVVTLALPPISAGTPQVVTSPDIIASHNHSVVAKMDGAKAPFCCPYKTELKPVFLAIFLKIIPGELSGTIAVKQMSALVGPRGKYGKHILCICGLIASNSALTLKLQGFSFTIRFHAR